MYFKLTAKPSNIHYYLTHEDEEIDFNGLVRKLFKKHTEKKGGKDWSSWIILDDVVDELCKEYNFELIDDYFTPYNHIIFSNEDIIEILKNKTKN